VLHNRWLEFTLGRLKSCQKMGTVPVFEQHFLNFGSDPHSEQWCSAPN
jgi:hypothetical protein